MRYVIVGGVNTAATYAAYVLLLPVMSYSAAYTVTYIAGIVLAYYLQSRFVFRQPLHWKKAFQFPVVYVVQYAAGVVLLALLVEWLGISEVIAPALVIVLSIPLTFVISRLIIKGRAHRAAGIKTAEEISSAAPKQSHFEVR